MSISAGKICYATVFLLWLIVMSLLIIRHNSRSSEDILSTQDLRADLAGRSTVPFNLRLPEDTLYLRVRVSGIDPSGFDLSGGRQHLEGSTLTIYRNSEWKKESVGRDSVHASYLEESFSVKSDDPETVALAGKIVRKESDPLRAARLIHDWVFANIEKVRTVSMPVSTEVLKTRKGDCNEHASLFTALARAAGVPSRIALGLVYGDGSMHYHAWPEIFAGEWIAVDPTLGQFPADASHIRLIIGDIDKQTKILSVLGKIKIEGLEYR
ncbi:MAG: transglutaminase domain-containing protein [Nitrospirae bacterium]|nr:transglutaminase domain-containing protein [Nitrospirota bacterium]